MILEKIIMEVIKIFDKLVQDEHVQKIYENFTLIKRQPSLLNDFMILSISVMFLISSI